MSIWIFGYVICYIIYILDSLFQSSLWKILISLKAAYLLIITMTKASIQHLLYCYLLLGGYFEWVNSFVYQRFKFNPRILRSGYEDFPTNKDTVTKYIPGSGLESIIYTLADFRPLLPSEYELSFDVFPGIRALASSSEWPDRKISNWEDMIRKASLDLSVIKLNGDDVDQKMIFFRKTILGLEKYRINNPSSIAEKYCDIIRTCLRVDNAWGAAANALQYAGLDIRNHVSGAGQDSVSGDDKKTLPILQLDSIWKHARSTLLDLSVDKPVNVTMDGSGKADASSGSNSHSATWDQKHWQQLNLDEKGKIYLADMLILIMRVAVRAIFSRSDIRVAQVCYADGGQLLLEGLQPKVSSVRFVLAMEFDLVEEHELAGGLGMIFTVVRRGDKEAVLAEARLRHEQQEKQH